MALSLAHCYEGGPITFHSIEYIHVHVRYGKFAPGAGQYNWLRVECYVACFPVQCGTLVVADWQR